MSARPADAQLKVELLHDRHKREEFSCGVQALDVYLQRQAGQDVRKRVATVYVATTDGRAVEGFYTLSSSSVRLFDLPLSVSKKLPHYPQMPVILLGRLAVSVHRRGQGVGEWLLIKALRSAWMAASYANCIGVVVDAKDESARQFYLKYGFIELPDVDNRLLLPMGLLEKLVV